jgi:hypothetical protein
MTTRICLNFKAPKKDASGAVVSDAEPCGIDDLKPFFTATATMILKHGDVVNPILDLDDKTLLTKGEMNDKVAECKRWIKGDLAAAFSLTKTAAAKQIAYSDTGCGQMPDGKWKVGIHVNINGFSNLWEHTLKTPQMLQALETCPLQAHPKKEGDKMVDDIYSKQRYLRILGTHKPGSAQFVKKAVNMKDKPEMHMPTLLTGDEQQLQAAPGTDD